MTDWSLFGGDPAPGDPDRIDFRLKHLKTAERALWDVHDELRRISTGTVDALWQGEAADCMRETLEAFRYDLEPIADSFASVHHALYGYRMELIDLQARARQALRRATAAKAERDRADQDRSSANSVLAQQRSQLQANRQAERRHSVTSFVQNVADPAAAAANAEEARRLAAASQRSQQAVTESEGRVRRLTAQIAVADHDLQSARSEAGRIHEEWDGDSKRAAHQVDHALVDQLKNKSLLEKALHTIGDELGDILRFMADPLHNISVLRTWMDRIHWVLSKLSLLATIVAMAAAACGVLPLAAIAEAVALALSVTALMYSLGKLLLDAVLYNTGYREDGKLVVTKTDLALDGVDVVFDLIGVIPGIGKLGKEIKPVVTMTDYGKTILLPALKEGLKDGAEEGTKDWVEGSSPWRRPTVPCCSIRVDCWPVKRVPVAPHVGVL